MKKTIACLLILMMAASAMTAWAAPGDATLGQNADGTYSAYYGGCFAIGDTLYLTNSDSVSTWRVGDAEAVSYALQYPVREGEEDIYWSCQIFAANESVYALAFANRYGEKSEFLRAVLCKVELMADNAGNTAKLTEQNVLNWDDLVFHYDQGSSANMPDNCLGAGKLCYIKAYDNSWNLLFRSLNVETGEIKTIDGVADLSSMTPYKDGTLLIQQFNYDEADTVRFSVYDPKTESFQETARLKVENSSPLNGLAYDAAADTLYCVRGGEIHSVDLQKGEIGPAIADAPTEYVTDTACILSGGYYCSASSGAFVRNLDPAQRTETRIRVYDSSYNNTVRAASVALPGAHGEVSVAIDQDYMVGQRLIQSMMNHDDSVDVYIMSSTDEAFNAVLNRGYMVELDGSETLAALAKRMYPAIRDAMSRNGHLVAIPVSCYASTFAVNEKALERLGLKLDDVPKNWNDMLDFIIQLSDRIKPEDKVNLFYAGQSFEDAKRTLFYQLFQDYQNTVDPTVGYDTELMRGLLGKLDSIDFTKLGCQHASPDNETVIEWDEDRLSLFETFTSCSFGNFYSGSTPVLMSMDAGTPARLVMQMSVAFINPYSGHQKEAMLYMEQLAASLSKDTQYCIDPELNTPVRGSYYEESLKEMNQALEELKSAQKQYADADPADRQKLEEQRREQERMIAEFEQTSWDISQANIDWYRANDDNIVMQGVNWLYTENAAGEASSLIEQYLAGQIDAGTMLAGIDKKVKMMQLEGN